MAGLVLAAVVVVIGGGCLAALYFVRWWSFPAVSILPVQKGLLDPESKLDSSVPLEDRIAILQAKLKDLDTNEGKYFDAVAKQDYEVKKLSKEVATLSDRLDAQWKKVEKMRDDLGDATKTSFTTKDGYSRTWTRPDVEEQLARDFKSFKNMEQELAAKKNILAANEKELVTAKEELHSLKQLRDSTAAKIANMKADLAEVRRKENETGAKLDSSEYARLTAEIDEVTSRLDQKALIGGLKGESAIGPVKPPAEMPAKDKDIIKEIDEYKKLKKDAPAAPGRDDK